MTATPDVIGYLCHCDVCGQRVLTRTQYTHAAPFVCPRCREANGWGDVDVAQAEPGGSS